jgi:enoyl-CoA hydratase
MTLNTETAFTALTMTHERRVLTITLNRPELLNAFGPAMHRELVDALVFAAADPDSDVVLLTGAGRAFSAGGDIQHMQDMIDNPALFEVDARDAKQLIFALLEIEKPVIAKVNGHAVGLGATVALFCDIVFMAEGAKIGDPHVAVGLVAGDGGAVIWPQLLGLSRAKEFLFTGELLTAERAAAIGLVNHAVPAAELDARVDELCTRLVNGATKAIRWTKTITNLELKRVAHAVMDAGLSLEALSVRTPDHREAVLAFREKRKPRFGNAE